MAKKLWSQRHPFFYFLSVWSKRLKRISRWYLDGRDYTSEIRVEKLPHRVKKHQSVLIRKLGGSDIQLQFNKVTNLKIAIGLLDGLLIRPGQVFSFCRLVGRPTKARGFLPGIELSFGRPRPGIGGGLCQISNLLHWLALHSPLTITERHHHSLDPFPDSGRVLPFGSGATVFYNYLDYQLRNDTPHTFQIRLWLSDKCLEGELRCEQTLPYTYHVYERNHAFIRQDGQVYRANEIWRLKLVRPGGRELERQMVCRNYFRVLYHPENCEIIEPEEYQHRIAASEREVAPLC